MAVPEQFQSMTLAEMKDYVKENNLFDFYMAEKKFKAAPATKLDRLGSEKANYNAKAATVNAATTKEAIMTILVGLSH